MVLLLRSGGKISVTFWMEEGVEGSVLSRIDYAVLDATATSGTILRSAEETKKYGFATLCVFPKHVEIAREILPRDKVCAVIAFPFSGIPGELKLKEVEFSLEKGAGELDIVVDIGAVKEGNWKKVEEELRNLRDLAEDAVLKLIIECCYLTEGEKRTLCLMAEANGWEYVKTSTGYGEYGATPGDVKLLASCAKRIKVKASGGIRSLDAVERFVALGADRIGTSSAGEIAREVLHGRKV